MRNVDGLLEKAKQGNLSNNELEYVVQQIQNYDPDSDVNLYRLLYILGHAGSPKYLGLVERFLDYSKNPMVSSMALSVLCDFWDLTSEYLKEIKAFIRGVDWDTAGLVRIVASSSAGEYLIGRQDKELFQLLNHVFEDENEDEVDRQCAYVALARAIGLEWYEIFDREDGDFDPLVLEKVRKIVKS